MKKLTLIAGVCIAALLMYGCGGESEDSAQSSDSTTMLTAAPLLAIDTTCLNITYCDSPSCWGTYVTEHQINSDTFRGMISRYCSNFSASVPPDSLELSASQIESMIANKDCAEIFVLATGSPNTLTNANISVTATSAKPSQPISVSYCISLFKGIMASYSGANKFYFFKAQHADSTYDIIFEVADISNNIIYYCDFSDRYP